mmetsp:Transcript_13273/g.19685  ORF Transcript_13273/g.19685 Transcript_13273/m.19685 type:complete len:85 (+) Transcript_13273:298-552(+)
MGKKTKYCYVMLLSSNKCINYKIGGMKQLNAFLLSDNNTKSIMHIILTKREWRKRINNVKRPKTKMMNSWQRVLFQLILFHHGC